MEELKKCRTCGKDIDGDYEHCPHCGAEVSPICKRCGERIPNGARYCSKCGKRVGKISYKDRIEGAKDCFFGLSENFKKFSTKKNLITIIKYSFVVFVCLLAFVFSFTGVVSLDISQVSSSYIGLISGDDINIEDADIELYSIDFLRMMFATLKYDDEQIGKFEERTNDTYSRFIKEASKLEVSYPSNTIKFSNKAKIALHDLVIDSYVVTLSQLDIEDMDGSTVASLWSVGIILLVNILATAAMFTVFICELIKVIKRIKNGESVKFINALDAFLPLLIALPLAAILSVYPLGKYVSMAGSMVATIIFISIASLMALIARFGKTAKEKGSVKAVIPNCIMVVLCIVIIGCCFAPIYDVEVKTTSNYKCDTDLYSGVFIDSLLSKEEMTLIETRLKRGYYDTFGKYVQGSRYDALTTLVESSINNVKNQSPIDLYANDSEALNSSSMEIITRSCYVQLGLIGAPMMSAGYFALIISVLFAFGCLSALINGNKKAKLALAITLLVLLFIVLAISVTQCVAVMHQIKEMNSEAFKLSIAGGTIISVIFAIGLLVLSCLSTKSALFAVDDSSKEASNMMDNDVEDENLNIRDDIGDLETEKDDNDHDYAVDMPLDEH